MPSFGAILKALAVVAIYLVLAPLLHNNLGFIRVAFDGAPIVPVLMLMAALSLGLFVVAFARVKDHIPVARGYSKGLIFAALYLVAVFIPSTLGLIAFEDNSAWDFFTTKKVATYGMLATDCFLYLVVGLATGLLFRAARATRVAVPPRVLLASLASAIVCPVVMWAAGATVFHFFPPPTGNPTNGLWFITAFYGPFVLTGICLPLLHLITRPVASTRSRGVLATTLIFALFWLPVTNFMVAFGWSFLGPFVFSLATLVPVALTVALAEALMGAPAAVSAPGSDRASQG